MTTLSGSYRPQTWRPSPFMPGDVLPATPARARRSAQASQQARVRSAARTATTRNYGVPGACYRTAQQTAWAQGGNLDTCPGSTTARGCALTHLAISEQMGKLRPGMAVYMDRTPGIDPSSVNRGNMPHWMTYLGKDADGTLRFADQYAADWSLMELAQAYAPRVIDTIYDPLARVRG